MSLLSSLVLLVLVGVNIGAWAICKHHAGRYWWYVDIYMGVVAGVSGGVFTYAVTIPFGPATTWSTKWFFALKTGFYWFVAFGALYWLASGYIENETGRE